MSKKLSLSKFWFWWGLGLIVLSFAIGQVTKVTNKVRLRFVEFIFRAAVASMFKRAVYVIGGLLHDLISMRSNGVIRIEDGDPV